jgi:hypothetical protein
MASFHDYEAYPGPDLRIVTAKVANTSCAKLRKFAKGRKRSRNKEKRCHVYRSVTVISNDFDGVATLQSNIAESRGRLHKVAQIVATFESRIGLLWKHVQLSARISSQCDHFTQFLQQPDSEGHGSDWTGSDGPSRSVAQIQLQMRALFGVD